jgi:NitT/TauT family transport system substrate-binding protein
MKLSRMLRTLVTLSALALTVGASNIAAAADMKINALIPARLVNEAFSPFTVAKYLGYYKEEGLDVNLIPVGGSNAVALAVSSGAGDVGAASPGQALVGMQAPQALNIKYFYEANYRSIWTVTVAPNSPIKSVKDLKGKKIGIAAMGSAALNFGKALAAEAGLNPAHDLAFIPIGSGSQAVTSFNQKLVDAMIFSSQETTKFEANGLKLRYLDLGEGFASLPDVGLMARKEYFTEHPKALIGFARAVAKGYLFSVANPAAAVKISWALFPESEPKNIDPKTALRGGIRVNELRMAIWNSPKNKGQLGLFIDSDWKRLVDYMKSTGVLKEELPLDRIYTNQFIPEINKFDKDAIRKQAKSIDLSTISAKNSK